MIDYIHFIIEIILLHIRIYLFEPVTRACLLKLILAIMIVIGYLLAEGSINSDLKTQSSIPYFRSGCTRVFVDPVSNSRERECAWKHDGRRPTGAWFSLFCRLLFSFSVAVVRKQLPRGPRVCIVTHNFFPSSAIRGVFSHEQRAALCIPRAYTRSALFRGPGRAIGVVRSRASDNVLLFSSTFTSLLHARCSK